MASDGYHEPLERLSEETRNLHRAIVSLMEELEAVDWYQQRADACSDDSLAAILAHNRDEEIEHACMVIEWLRRNVPKFDEELRTYLFTDVPIVEVEESTTEPDAPQARTGQGDRSLGIGSLKNKKEGTDDEHS
jgi:ferritin-like protein